MEQASQADPSVGAVVMPGEAADATMVPSPPDASPVPASTPAAVVADLPAEPSIAPDIGMVGVSPLAVVPDPPPPFLALRRGRTLLPTSVIGSPPP
jgi:hypothetical protein